jgi:hypothetical protein
MPRNPTGQFDDGIGALRWLVTLYRRDQNPDTASTAIVETLVPIATTHADIVATYPGTFYNSVAVDTPVSHLIRMRWQDYVETTHVIMRSTLRPSDGTQRTELYRVRRIKETGGRKRFVEIETELEAARTTADDSDAERERIFAEGGQPETAGTTWDGGATSWDPPVGTAWDP